MLKLVKGARRKDGDVGEVRLGVAIRDGMVMLTVGSATGQGVIVAVGPDAATQFALDIDRAAEAVRAGQTDSGQADTEPSPGMV